MDKKIEMWCVDVMYDNEDCAGLSAFIYYASEIDACFAELRMWLTTHEKEFFDQDMYFEVYKTPLF